MTIRRAAIVAPVCTPVGTFGGSLRDVPWAAAGCPATMGTGTVPAVEKTF